MAQRLATLTDLEAGQPLRAALWSDTRIDDHRGQSSVERVAYGTQHFAS